MLSRILKDRIQKKYGSKIKYPKDCYGLAEHIKSECKCIVSASTLKRAFGFTPGTEYLRPATKDAIANYLSYDDWDKLQDDLLGKKVSRKPVIEHLPASDIPTGQVVLVSFGKNAFIKLLALGQRRFAVMDCCKVKLEAHYEIEFKELKKDYPLLVSFTKPSGTRVAEVVLGEITGVTEIELLNKIKQEERIKYNSLATK